MAVFLLYSDDNLQWTCDQFYLGVLSIFGFNHFIDRPCSPFPTSQLGPGSMILEPIEREVGEGNQGGAVCAH